MEDDLKNMFFKLLHENKHKLTDLLAEEDSESDTASVMSVSRSSRYGMSNLYGTTWIKNFYEVEYLWIWNCNIIILSDPDKSELVGN